MSWCNEIFLELDRKIIIDVEDPDLWLVTVPYWMQENLVSELKRSFEEFGLAIAFSGHTAILIDPAGGNTEKLQQWITLHCLSGFVCDGVTYEVVTVQ